LDAWRQRLRYPDWHEYLLTAGVVPIAPYTPRNTDDPEEIEFRVEDRIEEHSEDGQLKQSVVDETLTNAQASNEPTTQSRTAASGTFAPEVASRHEQTYSLCCVSELSSQSPTTSVETIPVGESSRYETDSMARSRR